MKPGIDFIGVTTPFYCNDGAGTFVLHKRGIKCRDEQGKWDFGAGQVEFGQHVEESVLREVKEEYGVDGETQEQLHPHSILREFNSIKTHWIAIPFFVKVDLKKVINNEPHKMEEIGFFKITSLPSPLHSGVEKTMKRLREHFEKYR